LDLKPRGMNTYKKKGGGEELLLPSQSRVGQGRPGKSAWATELEGGLVAQPLLAVQGETQSRAGQGVPRQECLGH
jgi:hypothetical protein